MLLTISRSLNDWTNSLASLFQFDVDFGATVGFFRPIPRENPHHHLKSRRPPRIRLVAARDDAHFIRNHKHRVEPDAKLADDIGRRRCTVAQCRQKFACTGLGNGTQIAHDPSCHADATVLTISVFASPSSADFSQIASLLRRRARLDWSPFKLHTCQRIGRIGNQFAQENIAILANECTRICSNCLISALN